MNLINTVRVKEINDERFTESGAGEHRHQVSDRRNSNERGSDTSSGRGQPGVRYADRWRRRGRLRRVGVRSERGVCGHWSARLRRSSWCGPRLLCREPGRRGRRRGSGGREPAAAPVVRHGTARARAAPWRRRGGLVAARGGSRSDALGGIRPRHDHAHRGRARRGWPGRADPRLRAGLAAPCRGLRARAARARGDLHRRGVGHPRQRFDAAVAAAARRGGRQLAHLGRGRKPRHRGWLATAVRRASGLRCVARLARCHRPTAHPWTGLTSLGPLRQEQIFRERRPGRWGGLAGMLGSVLMIVTFFIVGVFVGTDYSAAYLIERFPEMRAARTVENGLFLAALILWVPHFLALYRALWRAGE